MVVFPRCIALHSHCYCVMVLALLTMAAVPAMSQSALSGAGRQDIAGATDTALRQRRPDTVRAGERPPPKTGAEELERASPPDEKADDADARVTFTVTTLRYTGNTVLSKAELAQLGRPYEHRKVTLTQLRKLCLVVRDAYRKRGYLLARAGVPPQRVKGGHVTIAISEGRYGRVTVEGNRFYDDDFILRFFSAAMEDPIVRKSNVERALLILNSFSDLSVRSVFDIGKKPGTTDVVLKVKDSRPLHVGFDYNNYGNDLVGRNRAGLSLWAGNLSMDGDELYVHLTDSFPGKSPLWSQVSYTMPLGHHGDRFNANYLDAKTKVDGQFAILDISGKAKIYGFSWGHPLRRSTTSTSNFTTALVVKDVDNFIFGNQVVSNDRLREVTLGYDRNWVGDRSRLAHTIVVTQGLGTAFEGTRNGDPLSSRPGAFAGNGFSKLNTELSHVTQLSKQTFLFLRLDGQGSNRPLTTPEQYALGGADSVRGFVQSEFLADDAASGSAELRGNLLDQDLFHLQAVGFVDGGTGRIKNALVNETASRTLAGAGAGLRISYSNTVTGRLDVGFPVHGSVAADRPSVVYGQLISKF